MNYSPIIGCCSYPWLQIYSRQNQTWSEHLAEILPVVRAAGLQTWEQTVESEAEAAALGALAAANDLQLASIYAGGILHAADWPATVDGIVQKALWMKPHGTRIVVVNPDPIAWGQPLAKDDGQLQTQLHALKKLGAELSREGLALAYHTHDPEMLHGAREFHHMMLNTDPAEVGWCLDTHWVWRGCGNSQLALDDLIALYGRRIRSLHLRQSHHGVWDEAFGDGDISHDHLVACLKSIGFEGPLLLEQAYEEGTPTALDSLQTHQVGKISLQKIFLEESKSAQLS